MNFEVGDIVTIDKGSEYYKRGSKGNPKDTKGVVVRVAVLGLPVRVDWLNGYSNLYKHTDLRYYDLIEQMEKYLEEYGNVS